MKRGEIYYIERSTYEAEGSEQRAGRPAIIVSNDKCNASSPVIEIVYLTTQPKSDLPTHIDIRSAPRNSVALCEQINSVAVSRLGDKIGECSEYEMQMIDAGLEISLALNRNTPPAPEREKKPAMSPEPPKPETDTMILDLRLQIAQVCAERETYRNLYEKLLERVMAK